MARGVNKVIIIGHLGQDPETQYLASGTAVTNISVATTEQWKDKEGVKQEATEWHKVVFWGRLAEVASEYLRKGSLVFVEGKLKTDKWEDKEGNTRYTTKIHANNMNMLGGKGESGGASGPSASAPAPEAAPQTTQDAFEDDDIPF